MHFRYLRLKVTEVEGMIIQSSIRRMKAISKHPPAESRQDVIGILSDQTDDEFRVYQEIRSDDRIKTIATGMSWIRKTSLRKLLSFFYLWLKFHGTITRSLMIELWFDFIKKIGSIICIRWHTHAKKIIEDLFMSVKIDTD